MSYGSNLAITLLLALIFAYTVLAAPSLPIAMRLDDPSPVGSGVKYIVLGNDGSYITDHYVVTVGSLTAGALHLYDSVNSNCNGALLADGDSVPANGRVCYIPTTSPATTEFIDTFSYAVHDGSTASSTANVVVVVYDVQQCQGIPDLGASGFASVPATPAVTIELDDLAVKFTVLAPYLRNQSAWLVDFFEFDSAPAGDSINGAGRTCASQLPANHAGAFSTWFDSQPRANYAQGGSAISNALFPNWDARSTIWTASVIDCDTVSYVATVPTSHLISATATGACTYTGDAGTAATIKSGLTYSGSLHTVALRPIDVTDSTAGYYQTSYTFPFQFELQQTITDIVSDSTKYNFAVNVLNLLPTVGSGLTFTLRTTISLPAGITPDVIAPVISSYPFSTEHGTASKPATITRGTASASCTSGAASTPCIIDWAVSVPELTVAEAGSQGNFDSQYIGQFLFTWTTDASEPLAAQFLVAARAVPLEDLDVISVPSSVLFFRSSTDMFNTALLSGATTFTSGEKIYARHSFLVDAADTEAYDLTLTEAYICWSDVAGFDADTVNTGCSVDIPGVMESALGQRYKIYDDTTGGIADVAGSATQQSITYGWTIYGPGNAGWSGDSVYNGFAINALPFIRGTSARTYYFHLVSDVTQARRRRSIETIIDASTGMVVRQSEAPSKSKVSGLTMSSSSDGSNTGNSSPASRPVSFLVDLLF